MPVKSILGRFTLIFGLLLAIAWLAGDLYRESLQFSHGLRRAQEALGVNWAGTDNQWRQDFAEGPSPPKRSTAIAIAPESVTVEMELWVAKAHPITKLLIEEGRAEEDIATFSEAAFGVLLLNGRPLSEDEYGPVTWNMGPNGELVHLRLVGSMNRSSRPARIDGQLLYSGGVRPDRLTEDLFTIHLDSLAWLERMTPLPDSATSSVVYMRRDSSNAFSPIEFTAHVGHSRGATPTGPETRRGFLRRIDDVARDIPLLSGLGWYVLDALPLLLFLAWVVRGYGDKTRFEVGLAVAVVGFLLLHFALGMRPLVYGVFDVLRNLDIHIMSSGFYVMMPVFLGIVLPALLQRMQGSPELSFQLLTQRTVKRWVWLGEIALALALAALYLIVREEGLDWWSEPLDILATLLVVVLIWRLLATACRLIPPHAPLARATFAAATLLLFVIYVDQATRVLAGPGVNSVFWLLLSVYLGIKLLKALFNLVRTQIQEVHPFKPPSKRAQWGLGALALVLVIPVGDLVGGNEFRATPFTIIDLFYHVDDWLLLLWFGGIAWILCAQGQKGQWIDSDTRWLGVLGISSLLFSTTRYWLFIPIDFLIGWLLFSRFVRPSAFWTERLRPLFQRVFEERLSMLDQLLDLNAAKQAYKAFRKNLREQLAESKVTFDEYDAQLEEARRALDQLREKARVKGRPVKDVALTFGPYRTAKENAVFGATLGLLLALPWILLTLSTFFAEPMSNSAFPIWEFSRRVSIVFLIWVGRGFFFGYFFPYLWGNSGLTKSLWLFALSVTPLLPLTALQTSGLADWQATLFWGLQVFLQCILLGLAFDYAILRQGRYDWRMIFEVHGVTSISLSISSIIVAAGTTVTTLLTSQVTQLITLGLKIVLPEVPELPEPPQQP